MFNVELYDTNFEKVAILDHFGSFIWSTRYCACGDFEISLDPNSKEFKKIASDYYLRILKDKNLNDTKSRLMIVEDIKVTYDAELGYSNLIVGRSLESLLDRRIIWEPTWYAGPLETGIQKLLNNNVIDPKNKNRKIDIIEFVPSNDEYINSIGIEINEIGKTLLEIITDICSQYAIGFKMEYNFDTKKIEFRLYKGENRTINNPKDNFVIEFSKKNENLLNSNFVNSASNYKNTILISGEGKDDKQYFSSFNDTNFGINRKEMYLDTDLEFKIDDDDKLSIPEYERQLKEQGKNELKKIEKVTSFEGEVEAINEISIFKYEKDFFLGDICYVANEYDIESSVIIDEVVESFDESGYKFTPSFSAIEQKPTEITGTIYIDSTNKVFEIKNVTKPIDIDWGDGTKETNLSGDISHTYTGREGEYEGLYDFKFHRSDNYDMNFCPKFTSSKVLYDIQIPNGVHELEEKTFYDCQLLSNVELPNSLKTIKGEQMFYNCINMYAIFLPNSIETLQPNTFQECVSLATINIPYNTKVVPTNFVNISNKKTAKLQEIIFPGNTFSNVGVETINTKAFVNCSKVTKVSFGSMVKTIAKDFLVQGNGGEVYQKTTDTSIVSGKIYYTRSGKDGDYTYTKVETPKISELKDYYELTTATDDDKKVDIISLNYTPPTLDGAFSFQVNTVEVPNSPKWDETVLRDYKEAQYWKNYKDIMKEKDGKMPETKNTDLSYAENSSRTGSSSGGKKKSSYVYDGDDKSKLDAMIPGNTGGGTYYDSDNGVSPGF